MNTNKILLAGLAGGVVFFLLGWLIYGVLLGSFMEAHQGPGAEGVSRGENMLIGSYALGSLAHGVLLALIFGRWANISTLKTGAVAGAIIAGLMTLGFDCMLYGGTTMMDMTGMVVDVLVWVVMGAIAGGAIAWVLGKK